MNQVPVLGYAVHGRVLAHRRDEDAVTESRPAQCQGREKVRGEGFVGHDYYVKRSTKSRSAGSLTSFMGFAAPVAPPVRWQPPSAGSPAWRNWQRTSLVMKGLGVRVPSPAPGITAGQRRFQGCGWPCRGQITAPLSQKCHSSLTAPSVAPAAAIPSGFAWTYCRRVKAGSA